LRIRAPSPLLELLDAVCVGNTVETAEFASDVLESLLNVVETDDTGNVSQVVDVELAFVAPALTLVVVVLLLLPPALMRRLLLLTLLVEAGSVELLGTELTSY